MRAKGRLLVVRAGALGDTLMTTPLLRALARDYPDHELDVVCSAGVAALLERDPHVAEVMPLRLRNLPFWLSSEKQALARRLRSRDYRFATLLERRDPYRTLVERGGIGEIRSFRERPFDPAAHAIVNNLRAAGLGPGSERDLDMEAHWSTDDAEQADMLLSGLERPRAGLHLGYGPRGKKKRQTERLKGWPLDNFVTLGRKLLDGGTSLVLTGSREDRRDVEGVLSQLRCDGVANLAGRTSIGVLAALVAKLDVFVSVDSGPAHLAAAVGTPLVVLWGPAILEQVRPMSSRSPVVIVRHPVPCAPCYDTPLMKTCQRNLCMEGITPEEVCERTTDLLRGRPTSVAGSP